MTDEERSRANSLIDKFGPEPFMQAYMNEHPGQAARIQQVIDRSGLQDAVFMLFNYGPQQDATRRVPGSAIPTNPRATGVGMAPSQSMGAGAQPMRDPGPRRGVTEVLSRQLPTSLPGAPTGARAGIAPISDTGEPASVAQPVQAQKGTHDIYAMFDQVSKMATGAGLTMAQAMAMIKQESQFDPLATSGVGAKGLIQMMPDTARDRGLHVSAEQDERLTPLRNLQAGLDHMKWLKENFAPANDESWFAAYNAGHTRLRNDAWKRMKEPREYANKVKAYAAAYETNPQLMAKDFMQLWKNIKGVK